MRKILIIVLFMTSIMSISCTDRTEFFNEYGNDNYIPLWGSKVDFSKIFEEEYLVAFVYTEDYERLKEDPTYNIWTDRVVLFQFTGSDSYITEIDYYGLPSVELKSTVFNNENLDLGSFHNFFFSYDLNGNGQNELILPNNGGGEQTILQVYEFNDSTKKMDLEFEQVLDPYYDYALQTIFVDGMNCLKIFPFYGNGTRRKIEDGKYEQKYLVFGWNPSESQYIEIDSGYEFTYEENLHW